MQRVVIISVLLHVATAVVVGMLPYALIPQPDEPRYIEVMFGSSGTNGPPPAPPASPAPPRPLTTPGTTNTAPAAIVTEPKGQLPSAPAHARDTHADTAAAVPSAARPAIQNSGLRVDEKDPTMILAKEDPHNLAPTYPATARDRREEGTVLLRLHIDAKGTVSWLEKLESSGHLSLDEAAAAALARWHFLPARQGGMPVASFRDQPVRFVLN